MTREEWCQFADDKNLLFADGFDDAIIGVSMAPGRPTRVVYDIASVLHVLMERDGMSEDSAEEYFNYNVVCAYVGPRTPLYTLAEVAHDEDEVEVAPTGRPSVNMKAAKA